MRLDVITGEDSMNLTKPVLVVDADMPFYERQSQEWAKHGAGTFRVDAMQDAIALLKRTDAFLFVAINEGSAPELLSMLRIMRDITALPIHVITSVFTIDKKIAALHYGADTYSPVATPAMPFGRSLLEGGGARWEKRRSLRPPALIGGGIVLSQARRKVFIKNKEIPLTKKEFDLLRQVMIAGGLI